MCERKSARRGAMGERLAAVYYRRRGCRVLEMNFRTRRGEIDVIAQKGDMLIFAEVKTRDEAAAAQPAEAVTAQKRRRIVLAAQGYLLLHRSWRRILCASMWWRSQCPAWGRRG